MDRIRKLFDYHTIAGNKELDEIIKDTHSRYKSNIVAIDDESLEFVAAGIGRRVIDDKSEENNNE